jgi:heterodisulfide reductase subunit C
VEIIAPFKEVIDEIKEKGGDAIKYCYQCGKCDTGGPWNTVRKFSMRKLIREATFGISEIEKEEIWRCTTCGKCPQRCPRDVRQIDDMIAIRRMATGYGVFAGPVRPYRAVASGLAGQGNPFNEGWRVFGAVAIGLVLAQVASAITEYFTSTERGPVQEIAESARTGPATTILSGISSGLESSVWAIVAVAGAIGVAVGLVVDVAAGVADVALPGRRLGGRVGERIAQRL